jgi:hypothetical protein
MKLRNVVGIGCSLLFLGAACALPTIHRDGEQEPDPERYPDPMKDPANRNEDLEAFRKLLPGAHLFAEWPMPDNSEHSKTKPSYTVEADVVTDNVTKLRWQRLMPVNYPGCSAQYEFVGRKHAVGSGCTWADAKAYCESPELAKQLGGGTWRLPTRIELESLIDTSRLNTVDPLFDDFPIDYVWSSSPVLNPILDGLKMSWNVDFTMGGSGTGGRYKAGRARCVSSPSDDGGKEQKFARRSTTTRDLTTQLEWQSGPDSETRSWHEAVKYCERLELAEGGWHLPSLKELLTIIDPTRHRPAINLAAFHTPPDARFWTSTEYLLEPNTAYVIDFASGMTGPAGSYDEKHFVRCVR